MPLEEELNRHGDFLFRWRSYLPILIIPMLVAALPHSVGLQKTMGKEFDVFLEFASVFISFIGLGIRCLAVGYAPSGTSGRNTMNQRAAVLNSTGLYSLVRHPLYLGNFVIVLGILLLLQVWWFALITLLCFWLYYERIMFREEGFLREKFGQPYLEWASQTPCFLPKSPIWRRPARRFSWRTVLRREYSTFFLIVSVFTIMDVIQDKLVFGTFYFDKRFYLLWAVAFVIYVTLRILKKRTRVLRKNEA